MTALWAVVITQGVLLAGLVALHLGLLRRISPILERAEATIASREDPAAGFGLRVGQQVPPFVVLDHGGRIVVSADLLEGPTLVLFLSRHCEPCQDLAQELATTSWKAQLRLVVIQADPEGIGLDVGGQVVSYLQTEDLAASQAFGADATPLAFLVDEIGTVRGRVIPGHVEDIAALVRQPVLAEFTPEPPAAR